MTSILILEDDPALAASMAAALASSDATVRVAVDGPRAIEISLGAPPDLALLDVDVPGCDGYDVCKAIREGDGIARRATIVMLTSGDDLTSKLMAFSMGADDCLVKPVDLLELRDRVGRWRSADGHQHHLVDRRRRQAIQDMVAFICHEVNNPLTVALMALDLTLQDPQAVASSREDLETARHHLFRIRDVLAVLQAVGDRTSTCAGARRLLDLKADAD